MLEVELKVERQPVKGLVPVQRPTRMQQQRPEQRHADQRQRNPRPPKARSSRRQRPARAKPTCMRHKQHRQEKRIQLHRQSDAPEQPRNPGPTPVAKRPPVGIDHKHPHRRYRNVEAGEVRMKEHMRHHAERERCKPAARPPEQLGRKLPGGPDHQTRKGHRWKPECQRRPQPPQRLVQYQPR